MSKFIIIYIYTILIFYTTSSFINNTYADTSFSVNENDTDCLSSKIIKTKIWTKQELFVWNKLCSGENADLFSQEVVHPEERVISSSFIETIILEQPYKSIINRNGLILRGAWFKEDVSLNNSNIIYPITFIDCTFDKNVLLNDVITDFPIYLIDVAVKEVVSGERLIVNGNLGLSGEFKTLNFNQAKITGNLILDGISSNEIQAENIHINEGSLILSNVNINLAVDESEQQTDNNKLSALNITYAKIDNDLHIYNSKFERKIVAYGIDVGKSIFINSNLTDLFLSGSSINQSLNLKGSTIKGTVRGENTKIGYSVFFEGPLFNDIYFVGSKIGGTVEVLVGNFGSVNFARSHIGQIFVLGVNESVKPTWIENGQLILTNARVGSLQDYPASWPNRYNLEGFVYDHLGGVLGLLSGQKQQKIEVDNPTLRDSNYFISWLNKTKPYSPQPYTQLAKILKENGKINEADKILFASRDRQRRSMSYPNKFLADLQWLLIGYGYEVWRGLVWMGGFVIFGFLILAISREGEKYNLPYGMAYSLDMFLPVIKLREIHHNIEINNCWIRWYFYIHKISGFIIVSFLIAGLTGLTK